MARGRVLLVAEDDPAPGQVVGRQLDPDAVADQDADVELSHLARGVGQDRLACLQLDLEHRIRQRLDHLGIHLDRLFLARRGFVLDQSVDAGPGCRGTASLLGIAFLSLRQIACMIQTYTRRGAVQGSAARSPPHCSGRLACSRLAHAAPPLTRESATRPAGSYYHPVVVRAELAGNMWKVLVKE